MFPINYFPGPQIVVPAAADVRFGTLYGVADTLAGSCHVPGASDVRSGVPVGATTGILVVGGDATLSVVNLALGGLWCD
jgi:hypothetical protein